MSYARFGQDGSEVYIYSDVRFGLYCMACNRVDARELSGFVAGDDAQMMLDHIALHRREGDTVPEYVDAEIAADFADGPE